jgi:hypothetical protein
VENGQHNRQRVRRFFQKWGYAMLVGMLLLTAGLYLVFGANPSGPIELSVRFSRYDGTNSNLPMLKLKNYGSRSIILLPTRFANQLARKEFDQWETNYFYYLKLDASKTDYPVLKSGEEIEALAQVPPYWGSVCRFGVQFRPLEFKDRLPSVARGTANWVSYWGRRIVSPGTVQGVDYLEAWSPDIRIDAWAANGGGKNEPQ